jgi:polysaccharide chain length determinant protein (PEP-CTERM system associated)
VLPGKTYKPEELLWLVWRRKWLVVVPFVVIFAGTVLVARMVPNRYRSETVILVVPQRVSENYVRSTVTTTTRVEDRLRSIQQQIISRTRLELIIRDFNLYAAERKRMPMEDVVARMIRDVSVNIVSGSDAFRIAYTSDDPKKAMQVAERLGSEFTNESLQDREVLATATTDFLQAQLEDSRRRLAEQEAKVADFQRRHAGSLPSERTANLEILHNLQLQVQALIDSANRDRDRRLLLERVLADLEATVPAAPAAAAASPSTAPAEVVVAGGATTAERLEATRNALKTLELHLKPEHPDVIYTKRVIQDLEAKLKAEAAQPGTGAPQVTRARTPEEANTLRRIQETRQEMAGVTLSLASKQTEEKRLRDQIATLQGRVSATPGLEAEFTALTRDYDTIRKGYDSLLARQEDSKVAVAAEQQQIGEIFKVLDRARLPEAPTSPNRPLINLLGALAGLGVGLGLIGFLEYRDNGLRSEDDVMRVLELPVLASIPVIETAEDRRLAHRARVLGFAGTAVAAAVVIGAVAIAWAYGLLQLSVLVR